MAGRAGAILPIALGVVLARWVSRVADVLEDCTRSAIVALLRVVHAVPLLLP